MSELSIASTRSAEVLSRVEYALDVGARTGDSEDGLRYLCGLEDGHHLSHVPISAMVECAYELHILSFHLEIVPYLVPAASSIPARTDQLNGYMTPGRNSSASTFE